ncbi:hypothetical protein Ddye_000143 [Dipteronia dyeriana]|uniref:RNase H type-1 domain-containing protein n=1 Tax=Dipteronia dyeriana TaxID=168575 RepID=A0AAE0CSC1_9ROSI|nr:hypothetical protein Ddye_000143 [Dipteronia dyeriana]
MQFTDDFRKANVVEGGDVRNHPVHSSWEPPHDGLFKINTDAVLSEKDKASGLRVVISDNKGRVMAFLCRNVGGYYEPCIAEAMAIRRGFRLAMESGLVPVVLESDALEVVNLLQSKIVPNSELGVIIHDISDIVDNSFLCSFHFVHRLANKVAHGLTKLALAHRGEFVWLEDCPLSVEGVLGDISSFL